MPSKKNIKIDNAGPLCLWHTSCCTHRIKTLGNWFRSTCTNCLFQHNHKRICLFPWANAYIRNEVVVCVQTQNITCAACEKNVYALVYTIMYMLMCFHAFYVHFERIVFGNGVCFIVCEKCWLHVYVHANYSHS